jgi:hypothetical protein
VSTRPPTSRIATPSRTASILRSGAMLLGSSLVWWRTHAEWATGLVGLAAILVVLALGFPRAYRPIGGVLEALERGVVKAVSWFLLGLVFFIIFVPGRVFAALSGRLLRFRSRSERKDTYWESPVTPASKDSFGKQF